MKRRIVILHCLQVISDLNLRVQFLLYLARKRLLRRFARFDLSAGEFQAVFEIAVSPLSGEDSVVVYDDCCDYFYCFH